MEDIDPATGQAVLAPLLTIAAERWGGLITEEGFARTWQHWRAKLAMRGYRWKEVAGPFAASVLTQVRSGGTA